MAANYSFDVVSTYDAGEMNNVFDQVKREVTSRYDFKGTSATLEWLDGEKSGFIIRGENNYHIEAIIDMVRKKAATREISQKTFDTKSHQIEASNLKVSQKIPFLQGLDQDKAKKITKLLRDQLPKVKAQIQGDEVRISSAKKDELQEAMTTIKQADFDFPLSFVNFR